MRKKKKNIIPKPIRHRDDKAEIVFIMVKAIIAR